jgi:ribonuclease P protein component
VRHASQVKAALAQRPRIKSAHFAIHITPSTSITTQVTDDPTPTTTPWQVGLIIPKRHHRQAVVRNTLKRITRQVMTELFHQHPHLHDLPATTYIIRLHRAWSFKQRATTHPKKSRRPLQNATTNESDTTPLTSWRALKQHVRVELIHLLAQLMQLHSNHAI